ncbi:Unknown protein, partial [Striga hermonthica]
ASTVSQIKESLRTHHPYFTFLSKTKKTKHYVLTVCKKLGFADRCKIVDPRGLSGGLLLAWNTEVEIKQVICNTFCIEVEFRNHNSEPFRWAVFVYMSTDKSTRESQWRDLEFKKESWGHSSCIIGDWNDLSKPDDKRGGRLRSQSSCLGFKTFISNMGMTELFHKGHPFTWGNNRTEEGFVEESLDKGFATLEWLRSFPQSQTTSIFKSSSDHY